MPDTATDLAELREIAERATKGNWRAGRQAVGLGSAFGVRSDDGNQGVAYDCHKRDAEFISTFNPERVLSLLDEVERLRELEGEAFVRALAEATVHDQHGPSYWSSMTDAGRDYFVRRAASAISRARTTLKDSSHAE